MKINLEDLKDADLVKQYQLGNKKAFAVLVKRWHLLFCKIGYRYVKDADVSKDIAQESWTVILSKIDTLKDSSSFKSWAISIVTRKSIDFLRKSNRKYSKLISYYHESCRKERTQENGNIENKTNKKEQLKKEIEKLPNKQKVIIRLFYVEEYSLKEISELLDISIGTTKSRLFHAREKLKSILKH